MPGWCVAASVLFSHPKNTQGWGWAAVEGGQPREAGCCWGWVGGGVGQAAERCVQARLAGQHHRGGARATPCTRNLLARLLQREIAPGWLQPRQRSPDGKQTAHAPRAGVVHTHPRIHSQRPPFPNTKEHPSIDRLPNTHQLMYFQATQMSTGDIHTAVKGPLRGREECNAQAIRWLGGEMQGRCTLTGQRTRPDELGRRLTARTGARSQGLGGCMQAPAQLQRAARWYITAAAASAGCCGGWLAAAACNPAKASGLPPACCTVNNSCQWHRHFPCCLGKCHLRTHVTRCHRWVREGK